ncbi:MAG: hypothetical protein IH870_03275 [Chloroflexi bacterium]|nr:hypothetical protein [Chloroflexota bacterium]
MDRKIALPVGFAVLALLAVVGMLSLLSFTAAQPTEASNFDSGNVDLGKITTETFNPIVATKVLTGVTASTSPTKASAIASYTFTFVVDAELENGVDEIIITWDEDFKNFPTTIAPSAVSIRAVRGDGSCTTNAPTDDINCGVTGDDGNDGQAVAPEEINVDFITPENADLQPQTKLRIPDMDTDDNSGGNGINNGATVTIVFRQQAGITNPTENNDNYHIDIRVTASGVDPTLTANERADPDLFIQARMQPSNDEGARGKSFTLIASGIEGGESITFFRDPNGNGVRDTTDVDVCNVVADRDDTATCTFTVGNPPFVPGKNEDLDSGTDVNGAVAIAAVTVNVDDATKFKPGQTVKIGAETLTINTCTAVSGLCTGTQLIMVAGPAAAIADNADITIQGDCGFATMSGCNFINFVDAEGRSTTGELGEALDPTAVDRQVLNLDQTISAAPKQANVGDTIVISLFDWPQGVICKISIGGNNIKTTDLPTESVPSSGEVSFNFDIPGTLDGGVRLPLGVIPLKLFVAPLANCVGSVNEAVNITIAGANLSLSHDTVLANQDLTITGNGFAEPTTLIPDVCILEGKITIGNVAVEFDDADDCPIGNGILLTSGGTFTLTVRVHDVLGTVPALNTALLTEGVHELKVIDTRGAEGTLNVTIATRSLQVVPAAARPRDTITIIGRAFIADNGDGLSTTVDVEYKCGQNTRSVTADPDVSGNFRETLRIPSNCAIPSTNTLTAKIRAGNQDTGVVETVAHEIPEGLVTIEPGRGASGTLVTVRGEGFRSFEIVNTIEFGGLGTLGGRTVNTDANGDFLVDDVLVPGLDPGIHAVKIEVSTGTNRTSASTSFEVIETGLIGQPTPVADVYAMSDSLLRIFRFDNNTKVWAFNDRREEFADANTLDELISGGVYWILIDQDVTLDVEGILLDLTCKADDCWNLEVWP